MVTSYKDYELKVIVYEYSHRTLTMDDPDDLHCDVV